MDQLVSVVDIGALTAFTLLHASVVGWFAVGRRGGPVIWRRHMPAPVAGAAITVAVIVEPSGTARVVGAEWLAVGTEWLAVGTVWLAVGAVGLAVPTAQGSRRAVPS